MKPLNFLAALAVVFFLPLSGMAQMTQTPEYEPEYEENAVYVRFVQTAAPKMQRTERTVSMERVPSLKSLQAAYGLHREMNSMRLFDDSRLARTFTVRFDSTTKADELIARLEADPTVELVERIPVYRIQSATGTKEEAADPFYGTVNGVNLSWHLDMIHAEEAWEMQSGNPSVVAAIVDNAIWGGHPDLQIDEQRQFNMMTQAVGNSAPPSNVDQNATCSSLANCPSYNWSHGTHCAGAVGAINRNGTGISSIGSGVSLMGVSCPGTAPSGLEVRNGFGGITWAAEHGAKVINLSWGSYSIAETERAIIQSCIDKGIVVVAAAGNDNRINPLYPAYLPGVISIASVNSNSQISSFSNYGAWVSLASPGGYLVSSADGKESFNCIFSTTFCKSQSYRMSGLSFLNDEYYDGMYGTSMATPVATGLCALLLSADSTLSPYLLREILMSSAQPVTVMNGRGIQPSSGIIDAAAALKLLKKGVPMPQNGVLSREGRVVTFQWESPLAGDSEVKTYQVFKNGVLLAETTALSVSDTINSDGIFRFGVRALYENGDTSLRECKDVYVPVLYDVVLTPQPENCGTVSGGGAFEKNAKITLTATPHKGCKFVRWLESGKTLGRDSSLLYEVKYKTEISAVFSGTPEPSGIRPVEALSPVKIYPNPTRDRLVVESPEAEIYSVEIYALNGRPVRTESVAGRGASGLNANSRIDLDISSLAQGIYLVKVKTSLGIQTEKINKL